MKSNINIHLTSIQDLFSEYGIRSISMDHIAQNLHISKKTIYKQYACKDELVKDIYLNDYYQFKTSLHTLDKEDNDAILKTIQLYNMASLKMLSIKTHVHFDLEKYYPEFYNKLIELYKEAIRKKFIRIILEGRADNYFQNGIKPCAVAHIFSLVLELYVSNRT